MESKSGALDPGLIGFRPLRMGDLETMHRWLNAPHVAKWWGAGPTMESVVEKYAPRIAGREPTRCFLILYADEPIGYIQTYRIGSYPDYARAIALDEAAAGIDLFVGSVEHVNRGLGAPLIVQFLRTIVFDDPDVESCIIGPAAGNRAAIRVYEKVGFRYVKTVQVPGEPEPEYLMLIARSALLASGSLA